MAETDQLYQEALEQQLSVLERERDEGLGQDVVVCVEGNCFLTRDDHEGRKPGHQPIFWPIDQAIFKLRARLGSPR